MANLENNNSENNKPISEKMGEKLHDAVEGVKYTLEHPLDAAHEAMEQAKKDVEKLSWWAKLFLIVVSVLTVLFLGLSILASLDWTREKAANYALGFLNKDFKVSIEKDSVDVNIFGDVSIYGLKIKDHKNNDLIKAKRLRAGSDWFSIITNSRDLKFSTLTLENAEVKAITYKGDSIDTFTRLIEKFDQPSPVKHKTPFKLQARVVIIDSKISIINQNHNGDAGKWLQAEHVNLVAPELKIVGPKIDAKINNFSFKTRRWGKVHVLDTFSTDFSMDNEHLSLKDLSLFTDHSLLQGDLTFHLDKETKWQDFSNKVNWEMNMKPGSKISGYDISYFATKWDNFSPINLSGKMNGPLNNFKLEGFVVAGNNVQINTPHAKFKNLLNGNFNIVTNQISANITYPALRELLPTYVSKKMKNFADPFGTIQYKGAVDVTPKRVIAKGNAITSIGRANADIILNDIDQQNPSYKGVLVVNDFNAAAITKNKAVGLISGKFILDGKGFDVNTLTLRTKSDVAKIEINGKTINNLILDGNLSRKQYNGLVTVNDSEARGKINGKIDFSTKRFLANIKADFSYLNLSYFGVPGNGKTVFSGNVEGKVTFSSINDMNLEAYFNNVIFYAGDQKIDLPKGEIKAFYEGGRRMILVDLPDVARGNIYGKYNLGDLGKMFQNGFDKVLVGNPQKRYFKGQDFTYVFEINQKLVNYFEPSLKIPQGVRVNGSFEGNTNDLVMNADAPALKYILTKKEEISQADRILAETNPEYKLEKNKVTKDSVKAENIILRINTAKPEEQIFANIARAEYHKNVFRDINLTGNNENNKILHLVANFKHGSLEDEEKDRLKSYAIYISQSIDENGDYVIKFEPTELKLNNFVWSVDTSSEMAHSITYRKKTKDFLVKNLRLYSDESELFINGVYKNAKDFNGDINVKNLEISKLMDLLPQKSNLDLKGVANGNIKIKMSQNYLEPIIDLDIKNIRLNGKEMGNMLVKAQSSNVPNVFDVNAKIVSSDTFSKNQLEVAGTIDNNAKTPTLNLNATLNEFDLGFVQVFVNNIFSNFRGKASGTIAINGPINDINYGGDVAMKDFGLKVIFNGVDYSFQNTTLMVNNGNILLTEPIKISDGRNNSSGTLSLAQINLSNLSNIGANVLVTADNLMLLNTEQKDFDLFWGKIYGKGDLFIGFDSGKLSIAAGKDTPTDSVPFQVLNNSVFTLNSNTASSVDEFKMLRFLKEDKTGVVSIDQGVKKGVNLDIGLLIGVDKGSEVNVLVGDEVGDISVRGNSDRLKFAMKNGKISLDGTYSISSGTYVSKAILEKTFQIEKTSSISWDRDPFNPSLNIRANYYRTVSNASEYLGIGNLPPINVMLQTKITQNLKNPRIEFDVQAPDVSSQVKEALSVKMANLDEKTLQFGSILVLNNFNTSNNGGFGNVDIGKTATNTGVNILLKQLGNVINTISDQFQIDPNLIKGDPNSNTGDRINTDFTLIASPRWKIKSSVGIPISRTTLSNDNTFAGQAEYDISKKNDGALVLRFYSKPSNIGLGTGINTSANQSYGAGVVYSRSFNSFFKKKQKPKDSLRKANAIKTDSLKKDTLK